MRTLTISKSDIDRCPRRSLAPAHYNDDGTCKCNRRKMIADRIKKLERRKAAIETELMVAREQLLHS